MTVQDFEPEEDWYRDRVERPIRLKRQEYRKIVRASKKQDARREKRER